MGRIGAGIAAVLCAAYFAAVILTVHADTETYQHDFKAYYYAAGAFSDGGDPYDHEAIGRVRGLTLYPYLYQPVTLWIFRGFVPFGYAGASAGFLAMKALLLAFLVLLWYAVFLEKKVGAGFFLMAVLAFNGPLVIDLRAGNIAVLEQALLWTAFLFFLRKRYLWFCAFVLSASLFKMQPALFLLMLLATDDPRRFRYLAGGLGAFGLLLVAQYIADPSLFAHFRAAVGNVTLERGWFNPSTFSLTTRLSVLGGVSGKTVPGIAYVVLAGTVGYISIRSFKALRSMDEGSRGMWIVTLACFAYALVSPRFKDYSYALLIVPAYFLLRQVSARASVALFILAVIPAREEQLAFMNEAFLVVREYSPLLVAGAFWLLTVVEIRERVRAGGQ